MKYAHIALGLALLSLTACGQVRHVFPPAVNVEQLRTPPSGDWTATVRLHNQSYDAGVRFDHLKLDLRMDGVDAGLLEQKLSLDVAERNSDVAEVQFTPTAAARDKLSANSQQIRYTVSGSVTLSDEGRNSGDFDVEQSGWLSPVPGVAHMYR